MCALVTGVQTCALPIWFARCRLASPQPFMPSAARSAVYRGTRASREIGLGDLTMACRPLDTIAARSLGAHGNGSDLSLIRSCRPLRDHQGRAALGLKLSLNGSCRMPRCTPGEQFIPETTHVPVYPVRSRTYPHHSTNWT